MRIFQKVQFLKMKNNQLETLDILTICSYVLQLKNLEANQRNIDNNALLEKLEMHLEKIINQNNLILERIDAYEKSEGIKQ